MKKLTIKNTILAFALLLLISAPFTSFASDKWSETPDLKNDSGIEAIVSGPATFSVKNPAIDMWDETPDLSIEKKDRSIGFGGHSRRVDHFDPDMYVETPDLSLS